MTEPRRQSQRHENYKLERLERRVSGVSGSAASVAADLAAHLVAADPHTQYLTAAEGNAAYAPVSHVGAGGTAHSVAIAGGAAGFMSGTDKSKLDGIASGATANSTDAALRDRSTHTGTQAVATITGLAAVATSGSATDLTTGSIPAARIANGTITNAMQANMAANTLSGNITGSAAPPADIALAASQFLARAAAGNIAAQSITDAALAALANMTVPTAFTPTALGATTAGTGTYTTQTGWYMQFGKLIIFHEVLVVTAHTGTGALRLGNLPAVAANTINFPVSIHNVNNLALTANNTLTAAVLANTNQIQLGQNPIGGGAFASVPIDTAFSIAVGGMYFTA